MLLVVYSDIESQLFCGKKIISAMNNLCLVKEVVLYSHIGLPRKIRIDWEE